MSKFSETWEKQPLIEGNVTHDTVTISIIIVSTQNQLSVHVVFFVSEIRNHSITLYTEMPSIEFGRLVFACSLFHDSYTIRVTITSYTLNSQVQRYRAVYEDR